MNKIKDLFSHNIFLSIAAVLAIGVSVWLFGCQSTTKSPFTPEQKVTRDQLLIQVEEYNAKTKLALQDLAKQDEFKAYLVNTALSVAQGGELNPVGIAVGLLGILGAGAAVDNRRKDTVIKTQKTAINTLTAKLTTPNLIVDATYDKDSDAGTSTPVA